VPRSRRTRIGPTLDVDQLAALLGRSTAHVYLLCEQGKLPHFRNLHNAIRFECKAIGRNLRFTMTAEP
jgi:predicted DNA-binding transcriptional regulator AlpA